jgi:DNA mismatch endonuclease (patch repair protein)
VDRVSRSVRSRIMAAVRGRGNRSTEARVRSILVRAGVRGWSLNAKELPGRPDFVFRQERLAVFVDGCFWHGCRQCGKRPATNVSYWTSKLQKNIERDRATDMALLRSGWRVLRLWEHEIAESSESTLGRLRRVLTHCGGSV